MLAILTDNVCVLWLLICSHACQLLLARTPKVNQPNAHWIDRGLTSSTRKTLLSTDQVLVSR